ncbi:hypothetical protein [Streptomyces sp. NBC_00091]|uniref:hypothetical protein n=1 Tax=Streptomyces sp. NBC_00091 TaxID=2975648 RepID=UPI002250C159|nr:hypothetical protein [Streptomyces sp. NBC_00091]MCX5374924.1 hypothetical protein [Streptomyces sp. NBC_00091]MCX5380243.1 hypothetical protein [Streptomyces sp. NBC_00091]
MTLSVRSRRTRLGALAAALALPAGVLALAPPAHAQAVCTVNGLPGNTGTEDDDVIICAGSVDFTVDGRGGNDTIRIVGDIAPGPLIGPGDGDVLGGAGNDTITTGSVLGGLAAGGSGNDIITTGSVTGIGVVLGDAGNDTITTGAIAAVRDRHRVDGGDGADAITVGSVDDAGLVRGGAGPDVIEAVSLGAFGVPSSIEGDDGDDIIRGIGGTTLIVGPADGQVDGGAGTDTCTTTNIGAGATINCP